MFIDVKKAHLNGVVGLEEYAHVKMPCDPPGHCRRLRRWLYGMRHAASAWEEHFSNKLAECGLMAGESSPVVFSGFAFTGMISRFLLSRISCDGSRKR